MEIAMCKNSHSLYTPWSWLLGRTPPGVYTFSVALQGSIAQHEMLSSLVTVVRTYSAQFGHYEVLGP